MIQFTKSIQLIENELFKPQIGTFTLLDGVITDENNIQYIKLQFELLQNHQSGNKTIRTGITNIPKEMFDTLSITYDGQITNILACVELLKNFNICDITDAILISLHSNINGNTLYDTSNIISVKNTTLTLPLNIFINGEYVFNGWAMVPDGEIVYTNGESITIADQSIELFAIWS